MHSDLERKHCVLLSPGWKEEKEVHQKQQQFFKFVAQTKRRDVQKFMVSNILSFVLLLNTNVYSLGKSSQVKCKSEANAPSLVDFVNELKAIDGIAEIGVKKIEIITDDVLIQEEIKAVMDSTYKFIDPEPAPVRVPDKVLKMQIKRCITL